MNPYAHAADDCLIIASLLRDVHSLHGVVFNNYARKFSTKMLYERVHQEGIGFLTGALPRLGKAFDQALTGSVRFDATCHGWETTADSQLPTFVGELFEHVFDPTGSLLPCPCTDCIRYIRQILYLFYKYELPYSHEQEQLIVDRFERTEDDLLSASTDWDNLTSLVAAHTTSNLYAPRKTPRRTYKKEEVAREAKRLLSDLFAFFDPLDITPRHGPGAVATRQTLWEKYRWTNICGRITDLYPLDAFYFASAGHVCDCLRSLQEIGTSDLSARVILVPKDSRGPRLISCEPVDFQWIQQGLGRAIVELCERHPLTKWNVFFTNQAPNQRGALLGSLTGGYATLDLNEASDRVALELVRLLFPEWLMPYLEACRSSSTRLPDGRVIKLQKFAPMGSSLCFPILALTVWSLLAAGAPDADARDSILVYGDDVIVPTAQAENAMIMLESFGLKINRDKSCTSGFFRESCGMDAFKGIDVTPIRFRTVWTDKPSPDCYSSWIAYANSFWNRKYYSAYDVIAGRLHHTYGEIPSRDQYITDLSLEYVPEHLKPSRSRSNRSLQKREWKVWDLLVPKITKRIPGWSMLLRYFCESSRSSELSERSRLGIVLDSYTDFATDFAGRSARKDVLDPSKDQRGISPIVDQMPFSVSSYTRRNTSELVRRWR